MLLATRSRPCAGSACPRDLMLILARRVPTSDKQAYQARSSPEAGRSSLPPATSRTGFRWLRSRLPGESLVLARRRQRSWRGLERDVVVELGLAGARGRASA